LKLLSWQKFYQEQINNRSLSKLIRIHGVDKVIAFLRENKYIMSLRPKWVHEKLNEYNYKPNVERKENTNYDFHKEGTFQSNNNKKSILSILEDIE